MEALVYLGVGGLLLTLGTYSPLLERLRCAAAFAHLRAPLRLLGWLQWYPLLALVWSIGLSVRLPAYWFWLPLKQPSIWLLVWAAPQMLLLVGWPLWQSLRLAGPAARLARWLLLLGLLRTLLLVTPVLALVLTIMPLMAQRSLVRAAACGGFGRLQALELDGAAVCVQPIADT